MDFTIKKYRELLSALIATGATMQTFGDFLQSSEANSVILRHDVDLLPENSLRFAKIQSDLNIKGSYYFRIVPESWDERIIQEIASLGHEIGYHYEDLTTHHGDVDKAYDSFCANLEKLRKFYPVQTICMHGSPRSPFDSRAIWDKYDFRTKGIIGEPYFDVDFSKVLYLTDTGRRWDGWKVSVRDKVSEQEKWITEGLIFHSTQDIIDALSNGRILNGMETPNKIMFTFHPQRWTNHCFSWTKELIFQALKNTIKKVIIKNQEK